MWCSSSSPDDEEAGSPHHPSELASLSTPLLSPAPPKTFNRWTSAFITVTFLHLLLFGLYGGIHLHGLMTREFIPNPENPRGQIIEGGGPRGGLVAPPGCEENGELPLNVELFYTAFSYFNFILMGSWIAAFWANAQAFQVSEIGPSTQASINRHKQAVRKIHPFIMTWLYVLLGVDSFGLAFNAYYFPCLSGATWKSYLVIVDFLLIFVDFLSLVIYPILFSGIMSERPLLRNLNTNGSFRSPGSEFRGLITSKVGMYLLLFVAHALFYLAYWIIDVGLLLGGLGEESEFYKSYVFFFTGLNAVNFWILASWIATFVVGHFRGASIKEALFENFGFFLLLLIYLLFTDSIAVALDAYQFSAADSHARYEFLVDFVLTAIDFLTIVFYPRILESFFPIVHHGD